MTSRTMRILSIITGALLIAAGIYCLCNQDVAAMSAGIVPGFSCSSPVSSRSSSSPGRAGSSSATGWLLLDGVLTVVMSLFLLFNHWFTMMSLPILFTVWLLFSGVSRFVSAFDLKALGMRGWGWILPLGIVLLVFGVVCMMDPWVSVVAVGDGRPRVNPRGHRHDRRRLHLPPQADTCDNPISIKTSAPFCGAEFLLRLPKLLRRSLYEPIIYIHWRGWK